MQREPIKRSHFAGGDLTPPLTKGDARPLWKPHLIVPASRGGVNIEYPSKEGGVQTRRYISETFFAPFAVLCSMRKSSLTTKITKDTKGSDDSNSELRALRVLRGENFLSYLVAALPG